MTQNPTSAGEGGHTIIDWLTIDSAPVGQEVLVYWPRIAIDDDGEPTGETLDGFGHVSLSSRDSEAHGFEPDNVVEANGPYFDDAWEFGNPTHWAPRPAAPGEFLAGGALGLVIDLLKEGVLSEGQVCAATGLDRVLVRTLADARATNTPEAEGGAG